MSTEPQQQKQLSLEEEIERLSHEELCEITQSSLKRLIASDPLLDDLPVDVTVDEAQAQIAVVQGQSVTIQVLRNQDTPLDVVIPQQGATVQDLKRAIQRSFDLRQQRLKSKTKISWRYVWRTYHLQHDHQIMRRDGDEVASYGVKNRSSIKFVKRLRKDRH